MKKLIALTIGIVISVTSFSQTFYKVKKATYMQYINEQWVDKDYTYPNKMFVIVEGYNVKITNESESKFILYGEMETSTYSTHTTYSWDCYDKDGRSCRFILKKSNGGTSTISILYSELLYCFQYSVENQ